MMACHSGYCRFGSATRSRCPTRSEHGASATRHKKPAAPKRYFWQLSLTIAERRTTRTLLGYIGGTGVQDPVPLNEPVKFDPPPPVAPPITNSLKFSGVPAWSEFLYSPEQLLELFTQSWLKTLLSSVGLTPTAP